MPLPIFLTDKISIPSTVISTSVNNRPVLKCIIFSDVRALITSFAQASALALLRFPALRLFSLTERLRLFFFSFLFAQYQYDELYMEYLKSSCTQDEIEECDFCQSSPWKGPRMTGIPRLFTTTLNCLNYIIGMSGIPLD